jgi:hypothetical protein
VAAAAIAARSPAPPDPITRTFVVRVRYGVVIGIASIPRYAARVVTTPRPGTARKTLQSVRLGGALTHWRKAALSWANGALMFDAVTIWV